MHIRDAERKAIGPQREPERNPLAAFPEVAIASDLSAAGNFINKIERSGEGFFYI